MVPAMYTHSRTHTPTDTKPPPDAYTMVNIDKVNAPLPLMEDMEDCKNTLQLMQLLHMQFKIATQ